MTRHCVPNLVLRSNGTSKWGRIASQRTRALYRRGPGGNRPGAALHERGMGKHFVVQVHRRPLAALLLLCVLAWLPGFFTLPPLDRDESRFAQATKQMLETGDFIDINLGTQARYAKPIGIYWLQAASTSVLGQGAVNRIWTYRVPSLLGALAAVAATFFIARMIAGVETAFVSGLLLGFSVLLMSEAKIAKTDAALLASIVATQYVLMRAYLSAR